MTIAEFRSDPGLVKQWRDELDRSKLLQLVMECLENGHPAQHAIQPDVQEDVSPTRAAIELGVTRGYSMVIGRIKLLGVPMRAPEVLPESEYKDHEEEEDARGGS